MLSILLALVGGFAVSAIAAQWIDSTFWRIFIGMLGFLACSVSLSQIFGRRLKAIVNQVQAILQESQAEAMRWVNRFQTKPLSSPKVMQDKVETIMEKGVREALGILDQAQPLYKWNILAERQIKTLKFQLLYQIREFDEADKLMPKIMVMDPLVLCMKLARQYRNDSPDLAKTFRKGVKKYKYEKAILIYGTYAWILMQQKRYDEALQVLDEAKDKTEDETLARNWQHVANKKYGAFSNAGLGDQWYSLHLDKPPKVKAGKGQLKGNPLAPKGKRRFR